MTLETKYGFRGVMTDELAKSLVGPSDTQEILENSPIETYSIGVLHPSDSSTEEQLDLNAGLLAWGDDGEDPEMVSLANTQFPSSMGLTFAVRYTRDAQISCKIGVARYALSESKWQRFQEDKIISLDLLNNPFSKGSLPIIDGLSLHGRIRPANQNGEVAITLALVNENPANNDRTTQARSCFFQPVIQVVLDNPNEIEFVDRSQVGTDLDDLDVQSSRLLFRHVKNLATGHGCAVKWDSAQNVSVLETTFIPVFDLWLAESNSLINELCLDMRAPQFSGRIEIVESMKSLVLGYEEWIGKKEIELDSLVAELLPVGRRHLQDCRNSVTRMRQGIAALEDGNDARPFEAFKLMSAAMVEQRIKSEMVLAGRSDLNPAEIPAKWRPFQLAFIIQCLDGLVNPAAKDRDVADLLWFPTGGGKTEAYLGLIAFTLMLRRLQQRAHGVSALMRYTLRLLTAQQFERAALLMCCCELIRQSRNDLGDVPFEVGLYIGRGGSPNNLESAEIALGLLRENPLADVSKYGNPVQVKLCVWCGSDLTAFDYVVDDGCRALCPNKVCEFSAGLPWWVVDEDLFAHRPSLVIGTVDKFAGLAVSEMAGNLFNRMAGQEPGLDLVIQDELHLISGPLGTIAGLYETAIDELGRQTGVGGVAGARPKIIASTATIRRALDQVRAVFDREVAQFPPPALDARDSYFAVESPPEKRGTRRYVGVMAPGLSQATLMVRTFAQLFHQATLGDWDDETRDTYWTLVAYFSSLRILASAQLLMIDDVSDRMDLLFAGKHSRIPGDQLIELTSRASGTEIPMYLRQLRKSLPDSDVVETVLATNMISVGVDIDRLGLMVIAGQPQSTAEYIQASSRVGRKDPGLVITLFNAARSRDRSHYESFLPYHSALYKQVEATSVTPFTPRARNRALPATLIILCRFLIPDLRSDNDAKNIDRNLEAVNGIVDLIVSRVQSVDPVESADTRFELLKFIDRWSLLASQTKDFKYLKPFRSKADNGYLLTDDFEGLVPMHGPVPVLRSMRDVDKTCKIYDIKGGISNGTR
jgi:hypothetical protein